MGFYRENLSKGQKMSLHKESQIQDLDGQTVSSDELDEILMVEDELLSDDKKEKDSKEKDSKEKEEELFSIEDEDGPVVILLSDIPGAEDQGEFVIEPAEVEVSEEKEVQVEHDPWKWTVETFLNWLKEKVEQVPRHTGKDVSGLERAIAYLKFLAGEISKATRQDIKGQLDCNAVEDARDKIHEGIDRLEARLQQVSAYKYNKGKKKKADSEEQALVKNATKTAGFVVNVPLFISHVARVCINSMVSGGHDIENTFQKMAQKYEMTKREQVETMRLLSDMGYHVRRDFGLDLDENLDQTSSDNFDFGANYPG